MFSNFTFHTFERIASSQWMNEFIKPNIHLAVYFASHRNHSVQIINNFNYNTVSFSFLKPATHMIMICPFLDL